MSKILYQFRDGRRLSYGQGFLNLDSERIVDFTPYFSSLRRKLIGFRMANRILRMEPRLAVFVDDDVCLVSFLKRIFVVSLSKKSIIDVFPVRAGFSDALNMCSMKEYGRNVVFWGDYGMNPSQDEINIYKYCEGRIEIVFSFGKETVKHIHNILYDKFRNRFLIFTGDFGDNVGIYTANEDFSLVEPFLIGNEKYRAVIGKVTESGLIWSTDSVLQENNIYYYDFNSKVLSKQMPLNGSVIYGTEAGGGLLISTTVEPYPSKKSKLLSILDNRKAPGIKSSVVDVLFISDNLEIKKCTSFTKDIWPMRLCQYGYVSFPYFEDKTVKDVVCNPMGVKKWDGKEFIISL